MGDVGKVRTKDTPSPEVMLDNLARFESRWKAILNNGTLNEISNLRKHIAKGCLSGIPPGIGTNKNEALHKHINPYFRKSRLGVQAAYALLCILFYLHNKKIARNEPSQQSVQSCQSGFRTCPVTHDHPYDSQEQFGVIGKETVEVGKFW